MTQHSGGCLCGFVRFVSDGDPLWVAHCHCASCRRHTASSMATFVGFRREQVTFQTGDRSIYASSPGVQRGFCARCGTPVSYESQSSSGELHLYLGCFDDPENFVPGAHVFYGEHLPWLQIHDALPRFAASGAGQPNSYGPLATDASV
jgi:hypothetical protein